MGLSGSKYFNQLYHSNYYLRLINYTINALINCNKYIYLILLNLNFLITQGTPKKKMMMMIIMMRMELKKDELDKDIFKTFQKPAFQSFN